MTDKEIAIRRSKENWKAVELLTGSRNPKEKLWNAASSRLYYAVLHLVFAEMSCHIDFKMGASTQQHKQARDYMTKKYADKAIPFKNLESLRSQADYETVPVSESDFNKVWKKWNSEGLYKSYLNNLNTACQRIII